MSALSACITLALIALTFNALVIALDCLIAKWRRTP